MSHTFAKPKMLLHCNEHFKLIPQKQPVAVVNAHCCTECAPVNPMLKHCLVQFDKN